VRRPENDRNKGYNPNPIIKEEQKKEELVRIKMGYGQYPSSEIIRISVTHPLT